MAERRQESCTSDGAMKMTRKKRYQLGIENVLLKGLINCAEILQSHFEIILFTKDYFKVTSIW